jgi:hypothetical protein
MQVLGKLLGVSDWNDHLRLGDLQKSSGMTLKQMVENADKVLRAGTYTKAEIVDILGMQEEEINQRKERQQSKNGLTCWVKICLVHVTLIHLQVKR